MTDASEAQFAVARSYREVLDCWRLVYKCYTQKGLINPNPHGIHGCPEPFNLDTIVIYGRTRGRIDNTLTVVPDGLPGLPLDQVYPRILDRLRYQSRRLVEVGLLADDRAPIGRSPAPGFDAMRLATYFALYSESDVVIGVHPHHTEFYVRMLGFEIIGPVSSYPRVNNRPVVPLLLEKSWPQLGRLPRLLRYIKENPVDASLFDQRFDFGKIAMPGSAIARYLDDAAEATNPGLCPVDAVHLAMQASPVC